MPSSLEYLRGEAKIKNPKKDKRKHSVDKMFDYLRKRKKAEAEDLARTKLNIELHKQKVNGLTYNAKYALNEARDNQKKLLNKLEDEDKKT